jgi:hypothetical protein
MTNLENLTDNQKSNNHKDERISSFFELLRNEILGNMDLAKKRFEQAYPQDCKECESQKYGDKK